MAPLIECDRLICRFAGVAALDSLSLSIEAGSWTYILGPSASGKTTLLRVIAGLQGLDAGEVRIDGTTATNHRVQTPPHRRGAGFLFQEPSLWPHLSALANVALGVREEGLARRERFERAREWLGKAGVANLADKFPAQLSGGEAQRVAMARTLASRPRILLLDEPTARLDPHLGEAMLEELARVHRELALTTLCVTHHFDSPMKGGDRAVIIERGAVCHDGPISQIANAPATPFTESLRRRLGRMGE